MAEAEKVELTCLLMGKTGLGKSTTGNSLLGRDKAFKTSFDTTSETKEVNSSFAEFDNYLVTLVDGPGLEDTDMEKVADRETGVKNMENALGLCDGGVDAFLFVTKFGCRFTEDERSTLEALKRTFGTDYMKHVIVIMTHGDLFEKKMEKQDCSITFDEWCRNQRGAFRQLYDDCKGRVVLLNNDNTDEQIKHAQRRKIFQLIEDLKKVNGRYTSKSFQAAKAARDKMIVELKAPQLGQQFQAKADLLSADIEQLKGSDPNPVALAMILKGIQELREEIIKHDMETGVLDDWMKAVEKLESHLHNVEEFQRLEDISRHNARELQRLEELNCHNVKELENMKESNRINAEKLQRMEEDNRYNALELQHMKERYRDNVEELQRMKESNHHSVEAFQRMEERYRDNNEKFQLMWMALLKQQHERPAPVIQTPSRCTIS